MSTTNTPSITIIRFEDTPAGRRASSRPEGLRVWAATYFELGEGELFLSLHTTQGDAVAACIREHCENGRYFRAEGLRVVERILEGS